MIKKQLILSVLLILTLAYAPLLAMARYDTGEFDGEGCYPPRGNNPIHVLIVYDEEVASNSYSWFGRTINGVTYIRCQTIRALSRFPFEFELGYAVVWNSDDSADLSEAVLEVQKDVGWNHGKFADGVWYSLLVAWTGQDNDGVGGVAHIGHGACLIKIQADWTDDNTVQHEVTHLFGIPTHCEDDCVMSYKRKWYYWFSESLEPIEDRSVTIHVWNFQLVALVTHRWCEYHWNQLLSSEGKIDDTASSLDALEEINPVNPPPEELPEMNPAHPWMPWVIGAAVVVSTCAIAVYLYRKRQRRLAEASKPQLRS